MKLSTARTIDRGIIFVAAVILACEQYGYPSNQAWASFNRKYPYILIGLIFIAGFFGVMAPFESLSQRLRFERRVVMRRQILTAFGELLKICTSIDPPNTPSDPALHFWQKKRTFQHPFQGELTRIATYRLGSAP